MPDEKLERLKRQRAEISARIQREESRLQQQARRDDDRRKILWGVLLISLMEKDEVLAQAMRARLDALLYKDKDRALFDFLSVETGAAAPSPSELGQSLNAANGAHGNGHVPKSPSKWGQ